MRLRTWSAIPAVVVLSAAAWGQDTTDPDAVADLRVVLDPTDATRVEVKWTATGDDGMSGPVRRYLLRYQATPIELQTFGGTAPHLKLVEPDSWPVAPGTWVPGVSTITVPVVNLPPGWILYFGVMAMDDVGRKSPLSLTPPVEYDVLPPPSIDDLVATPFSESIITLNWTARGDDNSRGTARSYEIKVSTTGPITNEAEWNAARPAPGGFPEPGLANQPQSMLVRPLEADTPHYFALKAVDFGGQWTSEMAVASGRTPPESPKDSEPGPLACTGSSAGGGGLSPALVLIVFLSASFSWRVR